MSASHVRPNSRRLTDDDARHLLAFGLLRACHQHGPSRVALEIGCDEKTVRRARDEESTLGLACAWNLLDVDLTALDALAAAKDVRIVPMSREAGKDALLAAAAYLHKLAEARDPTGPGGSIETDVELIAEEAELDALLDALNARKVQIARAKLKVVAA